MLEEVPSHNSPSKRPIQNKKTVEKKQSGKLAKMVSWIERKVCCASRAHTVNESKGDTTNHAHKTSVAKQNSGTISKLGGDKTKQTDKH